MRNNAWLVGLFILSLLAVSGLYLVDLFTYRGALQARLGISLIGISLITAAGHLGLRVRYGVGLTPGLSQGLLWGLMPLSFSLGMLMRMLELEGGLHLDYFIANFKIDYSVLLRMAGHWLLFGLVHLRKEWVLGEVRRCFKAWYLGVMLLGLMGVYGIYLADPLRFREIVREDGPVEYVSFLAFALGSLMAVLVAKKIRYLPLGGRPRKVLAGMFVCLAVGLGVIAGEEISWGQRLIGFDTPEHLAAVNTQNELNIHNHELIWPYVYTGYALIGLYGSLMWVVRFAGAEWIRHSKSVAIFTKMLIPDWYLAVNFGFNLNYVWLRSHHGPWKYVLWEEISELFLAVGILVFLLDRWLWLGVDDKNRNVVAKITKKTNQ